MPAGIFFVAVVNRESINQQIFHEINLTFVAGIIIEIMTKTKFIQLFASACAVRVGKIRNLLIIFIFVFTSSFLEAQSSLIRCGSQAYLGHRIAEDSSIVSRMHLIEQQTDDYIKNTYQVSSKTIVTIPVVVHVLYYNSAQNISDAQIFSQIDVLNEDYGRTNTDTSDTPAMFKGVAADCQIRFCLAKRDPDGNPTNGITRTQTNKSVFDLQLDDAKYSAQGGHDIWDRDKYLNLWVVPAIKDGSTTGILGYSQFPGGGSAATDGVVIGYKYFGRIGYLNPNYDKGRTATHEIGHWLNLIHIWGDDGGQCWGSDNVADTPNQADETTGCPTFPQPSCGNTSDMFSNYMDYTNDDCMNIFTQGQKARMWAVLNGFRMSLKSSDGCLPVGMRELSQTNGIKLYPNPAREIINISFADNFTGSVEMLNTFGVTVFKSSVLDSENQIINISGLPSGLYFIRIKSGNFLKIKKIQIIK